MIIDDHRAIFDAARDEFAKYNVDCICIPSFCEAVQKLLTSHYSLIVMSIRSKQKDFIQQLSAIHRITTAAIIVVTTQPYCTAFKIECLKAGADAVGDMPDTAIEGVAIAMAFIRRFTQVKAPSKSAPVLIESGIMLSIEHHIIFIEGKPVKLRRKEFNILYLLMRNPRQVFTHNQIYNQVWGEDYFQSTNSNALWNQVNRLRKKIQLYSYLPEYIKTVHGIGYCFDP